MENQKRKTAVVTGGTGGIGTAMARQMAKRGHNVVVTYVAEDEKDEAQQLLDEIKADTGCDGITVYTDVTEYAQCEALMEQAAEKFGSIDVLANNAGIFCPEGEFHEMDLEQIDNTIKVNLNGVMYCTRAALPYMLQQESGCIANVASIAGMDSSPHNAEYSASKSGVIGFSRSIADGYAKKGIRCNVIAPGIIETQMTDGRLEKETAAIPMGRQGTPEEIADALDYIVHASYLTGQTISPNGGVVMQ